jgi:hypothetical protein
VPGARKSSHSKQGRSQRQRYRARKVEHRPTLPVVVIVCDDTRTAPAYFGVLKREIRRHVSLNVVTAPSSSASPTDVVKRAIAEQAELVQDTDEEDTTAVWALIDLEGQADQRAQAKQAKELSDKQGVSVACSDPCYEVWTLLHLEDTGAQFTDCKAVLRRVKQCWKGRFREEFGRKGRADYSKIIDSRHEAVTRAEAHWNQQDPSRTEVFKVIQEVDRYSSQSPHRVATAGSSLRS